MHLPLIKMRTAHRKHIYVFFLCSRHQHPRRSTDGLSLSSTTWMNIFGQIPSKGETWGERTMDFQHFNCPPSSQYLPCVPTLIHAGVVANFAPQRVLFGVRRAELFSLASVERRATIISHRQKRKVRHSRTLYEAWRFVYTRPHLPRQKVSPHRPTPPSTAPVPLFV